MNEMSVEQKLARHGKADKIIADYQGQYDFTLPVPWVEAITKMLLHGLTDQDLHLIFNTLMKVEHDAGRLPERPFDYEKLRS